MININTFPKNSVCATLCTYTKKMHVYAQKGNKRANITKTSEIYKVYFVISKRVHKILAQSAPIFYKATYKTNYSLGLAPHLFSPGWLS